MIDANALIRIAKASLPEWARESMPEAYAASSAMAEMVGQTIEEWLSTQSRISTATGMWLDDFGVARSMPRGSGESDALYRARLLGATSGVTATDFITDVQAMLTAAGVMSPAYVVELPAQCAYMSTNPSWSGVGGTFATGFGGVLQFAPTVAFPGNPFVPPGTLDCIRERKLVISGAANASNNGTFTVTAVTASNAARFVNPSAVVGLDAGLSWRVDAYDAFGVLLSPGAGAPSAYLGRGYRLASALPMFVVMLPYGTPDGLFSSVVQLAASRKGAGIRALVERRETP